MILGLIIQIKNTDKTIILDTPMSMDEAIEYKEVQEAFGNTVYLGSEVKVFKSKKLKNNNLLNGAICILK